MESESPRSGWRGLVAVVVAQARALWDDDPLFVLLGLAAAAIVLAHAIARWLA